MAVLRFRPRAVDDLRRARNHIRQHDPTAAAGWLDRLRHLTRTLSENPRMGPARPEVGTNIRSFAIGRYVVYYQPVDGGVEVVRVLHSARDVRRHIQRSSDEPN